MDNKALDLLKVMNDEKEKINMLSAVLNEQNKFIIKKDAFSMENCVSRIENCCKEIAQCELKRREVLNGEDIKDVVFRENNTELKEIYKSIKQLLENTVLQKDTNEILIKQNLYFTNNMLAILNPDRGSKVYNAYGKFSGR